MKLSVHRFISLTILLLAFTCAILPYFGLLVMAQEPAPFEISLTPQTEVAVSGQPFTYTLAITNISQSPLNDIVVRAKTPEGTTLADTYFADPNWLVGGVQRGKAGEIVWVTQQPIAPNEGMSFEFSVNISPKLTGQQLTNDAYVVTTLANSQPIASGPAVTTQVLAPTPTPAPTTQATATSLPTAVSLSTSPSQANSDQALSSPTVRIVSTPVSQANGATSAPIKISQDEASATPSSSINALAIIGLIGLIVLIFGLVWFWKYR